MGFLEHFDTFCRKRNDLLQQCCYLHASPPGNTQEISTNYEIGKSGHDDPVNTQPQPLPVKARRLSPILSMNIAQCTIPPSFMLLLNIAAFVCFLTVKNSARKCKPISLFCLSILSHCVKCAEMKGFCGRFNSLTHISCQLLFSRILLVPADAESKCRTHGGRICSICRLHPYTPAGTYYAATILRRICFYVLPGGTGWCGMRYRLCFLF